MPLSAELRLLLSCYDGARSRITEIAGVDGAMAFDWPRFLALVKRHRVAPTVDRALQVTPTLVPAEIAAELRRRFNENVMVGLLQVRELAAVTSLLQSRGSPSVPLKGQLLSMRVFGDPWVRHSKDLDLLIDAPHVRRADETLRAAGYTRLRESTTEAEPLFDRMTFMRRKELAYVHPVRPVTIELHWRLCANRFLMNLTVADLTAGTRRLDNREFAVMQGDDEILYLSTHGAMHRWSRVKWLFDVAALLPLDGAAASALLARARERHLLRPVMEAVALSNELLGHRVHPLLIEAAARTRRRDLRHVIAPLDATEGSAAGHPFRREVAVYLDELAMRPHVGVWADGLTRLSIGCALWGVHRVRHWSGPRAARATGKST